LAVAANRLKGVGEAAVEIDAEEDVDADEELADELESSSRLESEPPGVSSVSSSVLAVRSLFASPLVRADLPVVASFKLFGADCTR
jgi:hypothetical protein